MQTLVCVFACNLFMTSTKTTKTSLELPQTQHLQRNARATCLCFLDLKLRAAHFRRGLPSAINLIANINVQNMKIGCQSVFDFFRLKNLSTYVYRKLHILLMENIKARLTQKGNIFAI